MTNGWHEGPGMSGTELERMARQAWEAWRDALRQTAPGASHAGGFAGMTGAMPGFGETPSDPWRNALDWWARQAPSPVQPEIGDTVARFNSQAKQWFGQMQQLAAQFAGRDDSAAQIAAAWRQALGGVGANPFAQMLDGLQAPGLQGQGFDAWIARARPLLDAMQGGQGDWMRLPTFGVAREHQERWQGLAQAISGYQQSQQGYHALLARASQGAFGLFERKLAAHAAPGQQIESPRALFDLWIDAAEEAYAEIALSAEFRTAYAELVNGQMRLRLAVQREIEQMCRQFDLPTRTELDGAHRKIADLERHLRRLRDRVDGIAPAARPGRSRGTGPESAARGSVATRAGSAAMPAARDGAEDVAQQPERRPTAKARAPRPSSKTVANKRPGSVASAKRAAATRVSATRPNGGPVKKTAAKKTVTRPAPAKRAAVTQTAVKQVAAKRARATTAVAKTVAKKTATTKPAAKKTSSGTAATRTATGKATTGKPAAPARTATKTTGTRASTRAVRKSADAPTRVVAKAVPAPPRRSRRTPVAQPVPKGSRARVARRASAASAAPSRVARKSARSPTRVAPLPNYGFISPIPLAPEPMTPPRAKRARHGKR